MYIEPLSETFKHNSPFSSNKTPALLPSSIEVVKHLARIAAENDYKHFLATGKIPYADPSREGRST